jgi:hypothetical protein
MKETGHRLLAIDHTLVHVDVEDVGAGLNLLAGYRQGFFKIAALDEASKLARPRDVGPLADHDKVTFGQNQQRLDAAEA